MTKKSGAPGRKKVRREPARRTVKGGLHRTVDVAKFIIATDAQGMMQYLEKQAHPDEWPSDNKGIYDGNHLFTARPSVVAGEFPGLSHWQLNLARQAAIELEAHVLGEYRKEIPNDIEGVCDRIDAEIQRRISGESANANELYYQAVVAFRWRWTLRDKLPEQREEPEEEEGDSAEAEPNDPVMGLMVMRKVFAFALDVSPRNFKP